MRVETIRRLTIDEFCQEFEREVVVRERSGKDFPIGSPLRFYACFEPSANCKDDGLLRGTMGNGITVNAAIADLGREFSEERIILDAYTEARREVGPFVFVDGDTQ